MLYMINVGLRVIEDGSFDHNDKLKGLILPYNPFTLEYLPISFGPPKLYLTRVHLWATLNKNVVNFDLRELIALEWLNIGQWYRGSLDPSKLPQNLKHLVLNFNPLFELPSFMPHTPNLTALSASYTKISRIPDDVLIGLTKLERLGLQHNNLHSLPDLYHLPLIVLRLGGNPLECNRSLCWLRMWNYKKSLALSVDAVVCENPLALRGSQLMQVHPIDLNCFEGKTSGYQKL